MKIFASHVVVVATCVLCCLQPVGKIRGDDSTGGDHAKIDVGLQLYSVRAQMEKDVPGTLDLVRKMGITDVEVAGLYNRSAESFRALLDQRRPESQRRSLSMGPFFTRHRRHHQGRQSPGL